MLGIEIAGTGTGTENPFLERLPSHRGFGTVDESGGGSTPVAFLSGGSLGADYGFAGERIGGDLNSFHGGL